MNAQNTQHPFEDDNHDFYILTNQSQQLSLWPHHIDIPKGWSAVFGPKNRQICIDYVEQSF